MAFRNLTFVATALFVVTALTASCFAGPRNLNRDIEPDFVLEGLTDDPLTVAFFPDGKQLVSGGMDRDVSLWDLPTKKLVRTMAGHTAPVLAVAVSADGKLIASGSLDHSIKVWNAKTGEQIAQLEGHTGDVRGVAFLPNGTLLSAAGDGLRIWNVAGEKSVWHSDDVSMATHLAVSRDGMRCAYASESDATSGVYDLVARKRIRVIQPKEGSIVAPRVVGLSPDGKHVFADVGGHDVRDYKVACFDVDANVEVTPNFNNLEQLAISNDGRLIATATVMGAKVLNPFTNRVNLGLIVIPQRDNSEMVRAMAISPDSRTVACAVGGMRVGVGWQTGKRHFLAVFSIAEPKTPPIGPVAGKLSWEVIPATVRLYSGKTVPLADCPGAFEDLVGRAAGVAPGLDVIMYANNVFFHRSKGVLEQVLDPAVEYQDFAWDGERVWVASGNALILIDRNGKTTAVIRAKDGLPEGIQRMRLFPLGVGKMLVAGNGITRQSLGTRGWIAVVEAAATGSHTKVFFRGEQLPADFKGGFMPWWITRPPPTAADHSIWIGCAPAGRSTSPILRVAPTTLMATAYNLAGSADALPCEHEPANVTTVFRPERFNGLVFGVSPPIWYDDNTLVHYDRNLLSVKTGGETMVERRTERGLNRGELLDGFPLVVDAKRIFAPGRRWVALNPNKLEAEELGPGLRVDGVLVDRKICYFDSALIGLAAISHLDGCMYCFSVDPAHPLPIHATDDLPAAKPH